MVDLMWVIRLLLYACAAICFGLSATGGRWGTALNWGLVFLTLAEAVSHLTA